ncbi:hypothetical protein VNO80_01020 [Phaseolus coccineus]|uniref:Uncharacterized protein n=1 Tax=Phaseolus coccineus TaxID=3886 RepID=A0AAN9RR04_PHACN
MATIICGGLCRLVHHCGRGFCVRVCDDDKAVRSGLQGEGGVLNDRGARECKVVEQEHCDAKDTYSKDAEICRTFSMQISLCTRRMR